MDQIKNSVILGDNEFNFINSALKSRFNKEIISIQKLYQATVDGGEPKNFHLKCDNIPNTLTFIKSEGDRRFGGFTSESWESSKSDKAKNDKYAFLFSIDKQSIFPIKNPDGLDAIRCRENWGPCFGRGKDIGIEGNPIKNTIFKAYNNSYIYNNEKFPLLERKRDDCSPLKVKEIEVFQIIFQN